MQTTGHTFTAPLPAARGRRSPLGRVAHAAIAIAGIVTACTDDLPTAATGARTAALARAPVDATGPTFSWRGLAVQPHDFSTISGDAAGDAWTGSGGRAAAATLLAYARTVLSCAATPRPEEAFATRVGATLTRDRAPLGEESGAVTTVVPVECGNAASGALVAVEVARTPPVMRLLHKRDAVTEYGIAAEGGVIRIDCAADACVGFQTAQTLLRHADVAFAMVIDQTVRDEGTRPLAGLLRRLLDTREGFAGRADFAVWNLIVAAGHVAGGGAAHAPGASAAVDP